MIKQPIEILNERLEEISDVIRAAYRNDLDSEELDELIEVYNSYFMAVQLIQSHLDIKYKFSKFVRLRNNNVTNRYACVKTHLRRTIKKTSIV